MRTVLQFETTNPEIIMMSWGVVFNNGHDMSGIFTNFLVGIQQTEENSRIHLKGRVIAATGSMEYRTDAGEYWFVHRNGLSFAIKPGKKKWQVTVATFHSSDTENRLLCIHDGLRIHQPSGLRLFNKKM